MAVVSAACRLKRAVRWAAVLCSARNGAVLAMSVAEPIPASAVNAIKGRAVDESATPSDPRAASAVPKSSIARRGARSLTIPMGTPTTATVSHPAALTAPMSDWLNPRLCR